MTDLGFTQADNNAALEKKFFGLQQYVATFEGDFTEGYNRRWRIIFNKINKEKGKSYDYRDIETKLNRNLPSDRSTDIINALKLRGLLSDETIIKLLNMDLDAISELSKMDNQDQENIKKNAENMKMLRLDTDKKNNNKQYEQKELKKDNIKQKDSVPINGFKE